MPQNAIKKKSNADELLSKEINSVMTPPESSLSAKANITDMYLADPRIKLKMLSHEKMPEPSKKYVT